MNISERIRSLSTRKKKQYIKKYTLIIRILEFLEKDSRIIILLPEYKTTSKIQVKRNFAFTKHNYIGPIRRHRCQQIIINNVIPNYVLRYVHHTYILRIFRRDPSAFHHLQYNMRTTVSIYYYSRVHFRFYRNIIIYGNYTLEHDGHRRNSAIFSCHNTYYNMKSHNYQRNLGLMHFKSVYIYI